MTDLGLIIAIVGSVLANIGVIIALFLWNRSEANSDRRDMVNIVLAIKEEMKDFHNRLIKIEMDRK